MRRHSLLLGLAATIFSAFGALAQQSNRVQIGVLECRGGASVGLITRVTHAVLPAEIGNRYTGFLLLQNADDLFFREP